MLERAGSASLLFGGERASMGGTKVSPLGESKTIGESTRDRDRGFAQAENESLAGPLLRSLWRRDALVESDTSVPAARMALASGSGRWAERTGPEACCRTGGRSSITIAGAASVLAPGWIAGPWHSTSSRPSSTARGHAFAARVWWRHSRGAGRSSRL